MIREICRRTSMEMYSFFRGMGLLSRCCCVAKIISGSSQAVSISKGDVNGSEKKVSDRLHELLGVYSTMRVKILINRLHVIVLIHIMYVFEKHIVGNIMIVGKIIFSIGVDLSFVHSLSHIGWRLKLVGLGLLQLRMRRILEEQLVSYTLVSNVYLEL